MNRIYFNDFQIGLFGIVGLAGVFATPWAGKQIAAGGENRVALICMWLLIIAWIPLYFCPAVIICLCHRGYSGLLWFVCLSCFKSKSGVPDFRRSTFPY